MSNRHEHSWEHVAYTNSASGTEDDYECSCGAKKTEIITYPAKPPEPEIPVTDKMKVSALNCWSNLPSAMNFIDMISATYRAMRALEPVKRPNDLGALYSRGDGYQGSLVPNQRSGKDRRTRVLEAKLWEMNGGPLRRKTKDRRKESP